MRPLEVQLKMLLLSLSMQVWCGKEVRCVPLGSIGRCVSVTLIAGGRVRQTREAMHRMLLMLLHVLVMLQLMLVMLMLLCQCVLVMPCCQCVLVMLCLQALGPWRPRRKGLTWLQLMMMQQHHHVAVHEGAPQDHSLLFVLLMVLLFVLLLVLLMRGDPARHQCPPIVSTGTILLLMASEAKRWPQLEMRRRHAATSP